MWARCTAWPGYEAKPLPSAQGQVSSPGSHTYAGRHRFTQDRHFSELISSPQLLKRADKKKSNSWQDQQHCEHLLDRDRVPMGKQLPSKKKLQEDPMLISFMGWYK